MIEAIRNLGKLLEKEETAIDTLIVAEIEGGVLKDLYTTREFDVEKLNYREVRAPSRCKSDVPVIRLETQFKSKEKAEESVKKKVDCLRKILGRLHKAETSIPTLSEETQEELRRKLSDLLFNSNFERRERVFLALKFDGKFPGEIPQMVKTVRELSAKEMDYEEGVCALCGERTGVSGKKFPFSFYTIDKPGYVPGLRKELHIRGFPVCPDCLEAVERAKKKLEEHKFSLVKEAPKYYLVPDFVLNRAGEMSAREIVEIIYDYDFLKKRKKLNLSIGELERLSEDNEDILSILKELGDFLSFHFIFIQKKQSQDQIKLHIPDVFPSRIRELFRAKEFVDRNFYSNYGREFTLKILSQFFPKVGKDKTVQREFLELIDSIFRKVPYSKEVLIGHLLQGIREAYLKEISEGTKTIPYRSFDALASYLFVKAATEGEMEDLRKGSVKELVESLPLLKNPEEKGIFLLGVLTQRLLDKQAKERGGTAPFLKKLKGFRLDRRDFEEFPLKLRGKLEEYEAFKGAERELFDLAMEYFSRSKEWNLSIERMNFVFAAGMGMKNSVYNQIFGGGKDDKE